MQKNDRTEVYLSLGSNLGNKQEFLSQAVSDLKAEIEDMETSSIYQTAPWGKTNQPDFLNICLKGYTQLKPAALLAFVKDIESKLGRTPAEKWGPRNIDIDILFYGDEELKTEELTIPHPYLAERAFVLIPLAEIAPDFIHPMLDKSISQLAEEKDAQGVEKLKDE